MAKIDVNTEYEEMIAQIQHGVDHLRESLWKVQIPPEALEQKLSRTRFSDAEKTCIRFAYRATRVEGGEADALMNEWNLYSLGDAAEAAFETAMFEAERANDHRRVIRLHELGLMADSCVEAALTRY